MFEDLAPEEVLAAVASADFRVLEPVDVMGGKRIDAIAALERVVRVAQARIVEQASALLAERQEAGPLGHGDHTDSVAAEVALARGMSPTAGQTLLGLAVGLRPMVHVRTAFANGAINEATVRAIVRESADLDREACADIDAALADRLVGLTPKRAAELTRTLIITIDVEAEATREKRERARQYVSYWPEAHGVGTLIVRGPAEQLVGVRDTLQAHADRLRARGDARDRGQIMVNTLFERVTGLQTLDGPDVDLSILMPIEALQGQSAAAELAGHGPITPHLAAELTDQAGNAWFRRLFTDSTGNLAGIDLRRRCFTGNLARWIHTRDHHTCQQPFCDCRSREVDHITPYRVGGPTTERNGQALCTRSNQVKELPGWHVQRDTAGDVTWTTPTGHAYVAPPPRPHRRT